MSGRRVLGVVVLVGGAGVAGPDLPLADAPVWSPALLQRIEAEASGARALRDAAWISGFNRVQPSDEHNRAADALAAAAREAGLEDIQLLDFPADGRSFLGTYRALPAWDALRGELTVEHPDGRRERIADYREIPVSLAVYSRSASLRARLVDVGSGATPADYERLDVHGAVVLALGPLPDVQREAVFCRGAAGIVSSDYIGPPSTLGTDKDLLIGWGQNHRPTGPAGEPSRFAFMIAPRTAARLRAELIRSPLFVRVEIEARVHEGTYRVVTGVVRGRRPEAGEFLLTAHLDHAAPSAEDDASGCAVNLEAARVLTRLVREGALPDFDRTLRFLWGPEVVGTIAYLTRDPGRGRRVVAAFHQDMVGASFRRTGSVLVFRRTPDWRPSALDTLLSAAVQELAASSRERSPGGPGPRYLETVGDPDPYLAEMVDYERGGDDYVLNDSSFRIPTAHVGGWPYHRIHTDQDRPEFLDATRLKRQAALVAMVSASMASAAPERWLALLPRVFGEELMGLGRAAGRPSLWRLKRHRALAALASVDALALGDARVASATQAARARIEALAPADLPFERQGLAALVPVRRDDVQGPTRLFFFDYLAERSGADYAARLALFRNHPGQGHEIAYTALSLVDGLRNVGAITDAISALVTPVDEDEILGYLRLLETVGVVRLGDPCTCSDCPGTAS